MFRKVFQKVVIAFLIIVSLLWVGSQLPCGQSYLKRLIESQIESSSGMKVTIERVDLFLFYARLHRVRIEDPKDKAVLFSCEEVSAACLLFDLPWKRLTLFHLRVKEGYIDIDKMEERLKGVGRKRVPYSVFISSYQLLSCHIISHRLPLHQSSIDCSLRGKIRFSRDGSTGKMKLSLTRGGPNAWPKRLDVEIRKYGDEFQGKGSLFLSTGGPLFVGDDHIDLSCSGTLQDTSSIKKLVGTWAAVFPSATQLRWDDLLLNRAVQAEGTFSYIPHNSLEATCDKFHGLGTLTRLLKDSEQVLGAPPLMQTLQSVFVQGTARIGCVSTEDDALRIKISLPYFSLNKLKGNLKGTIDLSLDQHTLRSSYAFDGELTSEEKSLPIKCSGSATLEHKNLTGTLDLFASPFYWKSRVSDGALWTSFRCQDLSFFQPLIQKPLSGNVELSLQTNFQTPSIPSSLSCRFSDFSFSSIRCGQGDLFLSQDNQNPYQLFVTSDFTGLTLDSIEVNKLHATGKVDLQTKAIHCTDIRVVGRKNRLVIDVFGSGEIQVEERAILHGLFHHVEGLVGGEKLKIEKPLQVEYSHGLLSIPAVTMLVSDQGRVTGSWQQVSNTDATADVVFYHIPFSLLAKLSEFRDAIGTIDGECHYSTTPASVTATGKLHSELQLDVHRMSLGGAFSIEDSSLHVEACAAGTGIEEPLVLTLTCPVARIAQTPYISLGSSTVKGNIHGEVRLSQVLTYFVATEVDVDAIIGADITLAGTAASPTMEGAVHLKGGTFGMIPTGLVLSNVEMEGRLDHGKLYVDRISANDGKNGSVTGSGQLESLFEETFRWKAELSCLDVEVINLDYATATGDGKIRLEGDTSSLSIVGSAKTNKALLDVAVRFLPTVPEIPVIFCDEKKSSSVNSFRVLFDLVIDAHSGVELHGRGLSSVWEGSLHLGESPTNLQGIMQCTHGTLTLANKEITINEGTMSFAGNVFTDSRLNISANVSLPTITAQAILKGSLENPKLSLQSIPAKPDNEILSLIIFNKEFGDISPLESFQLANVATLFQQSSGPFSLIDKVKTTFGIDTIDVGPSSTPTAPKSKVDSMVENDESGDSAPEPQNDVSLKVGKYISEGVAVNVSRDVSAEANRVGISAEISTNVTVEAEIGDDNAAIVALKWKKNY